MSIQTNTTPNDNKPTNKLTIARWILCGVFATFTLVNDIHYSSLFLLLAAVVVLPLPFVDNLYNKIKIKPIIALILACVLFLVGAVLSPLADDEETSTNTENIITSSENSFSETSTSSESTSSESTSSSDEISSSETSESGNISSTESSKPSNTSSINSTVKPNNTTSNNEQETMVWISATGKKYHSKPSCGSMKSGTKVTLKEAQNQGLTACKNCH